jgi:hypothetical protein
VQELQKRPKPLDDALELKIKQRLKDAEATAAFESAMEEARFAMSDYQTALADYEASLDDPTGERLEKPAPVDLKAVADKYRLTYGSLEMADYETLRDSELGQALEFDRQGQRLVTGAEIIFSGFDSLSPFYPHRIGGNYVYWVTEKRPSYVPKLDEARAEVVQYWKEQQAYQLAQAAAEKAAEQVRTGGKPLTEQFPDTAKLTGEFAWFSSAPPLGVDQPGHEFLKTAYKLEEGGVGVAPNEDRSAIYTVQKIKDDPRTLEELRTAFFKNLATFKQPYVTNVPVYYAQRSVQDWVEYVNQELGVKWIAY